MPEQSIRYGPLAIDQVPVAELPPATDVVIRGGIHMVKPGDEFALHVISSSTTRVRIENGDFIGNTPYTPPFFRRRRLWQLRPLVGYVMTIRTLVHYSWPKDAGGHNLRVRDLIL